MPFEPTTPPPAMTAERCREVLNDSAEGQERCARQSKSAVAAASHSEHAAALRHALARLAVLDAAREAMRPFAEKVQSGIALDLRMRRMHGDAWHADDLDITLPFDECRALLAAYAQLGGPTDA